MSKTLAGYAKDTNGNVVVGAATALYAGDATDATATGTTDSKGYWSFTGLDDNIIYHVKVSNASWVGWREGDVEIQVRSLIGEDGISAPLVNGSIPTSQIQDGSGSTTAIAASAVTNTQVGSASLHADRFSSSDVGVNFGSTSVTIDDTTTTTTDSNTLDDGVSAVAHYLKAASGEAGWKSTPATKLNAMQAVIDGLVPLAPVTHATLGASGSAVAAYAMSGSVASVPLSAGLWFVYWNVSTVLGNGATNPGGNLAVSSGGGAVVLGTIGSTDSGIPGYGGLALVYFAANGSATATATCRGQSHTYGGQTGYTGTMTWTAWNGVGVPANAIYAIQLATS